MWVIILIIVVTFIGVMTYVITSSQKAEMQRYYEAAYRMIKEICLTNALKNQMQKEAVGQKIMIYLKWKDGEKQGYVFEPQQGVRIGRTPYVNEICIKNENVSGQHCMLYVSEGILAIRDLNSTNGTWVKRGLGKHRVQAAEYLFNGDKVSIGNLKITVIIFTFDMAYI